MPEQTGLLLLMFGAPGVDGSLSDTGPANMGDEQFVATTVITKLLYEPAPNPLIVACPLPLEVTLTGPCAPPGVFT